MQADGTDRMETRLREWASWLTLGSTGDTSHHAIASISTPKKRLTPSIQAPARGSRVPADTPTSSSGRTSPAARAVRYALTAAANWLSPSRNIPFQYVLLAKHY